MPPAKTTCKSSAGLWPEVFGEDLDHRLPQREARARADVPAALLPLEDEPARAVLQEHPQQARRRDVQVGRDALRFQFLRLIGPAAGDDRERRLVQCGSRRVVRCGSRAARTRGCRRPTAASRARFRLLQELFRLRLAEQGEREERQRTAVRDGVRERGGVAHPGHRPLQDRVSRAVRLGERRAFRRCRRRCAESSCFRVRSQTARTIPATVTPAAANAAAAATSCPTGQTPAAGSAAIRSRTASRHAGEFRNRGQIRGLKQFLFVWQFHAAGLSDRE